MDRAMNRKVALGGTLLALMFITGTASADAAKPREVLNIGDRLELFVDDYLVEELTGRAEQRLHKPVPREVVLVTDKPWEGNTCAFFTVFRDGDLYRMYYRGSHYDVKTRRMTHREVTCYAESSDGVHWTKPELGLFEFDGSKANNIVWEGVGTHDFTPFKDANPDCPPEAKYKALGRGKSSNPGIAGKYKRGLYAFQSPDGIHWTLMQNEPVITKGAFDSQNLAFWDGVRSRYVEFHRGFRGGIRDIMTCTSTDFLTWTEPVWLEYPGAPKEHLYTNAIQPYLRAPHIFVGFPTRYYPDRGSQVEPIFMTSRDGRVFHRWAEPLIPVTAPEDRDGNRSNYMTWGIVKLPENDEELSVYATEAYYTGPDSRVRRFTYRVDGFVSVYAPAAGGELLTKPLTFAGKHLTINFAAPENGHLQIEIQDADGKPIEGFTLDDCPPIRGDDIRHTVSWKGGNDLGELAGKPVRLRVHLNSAHLYSCQFGD